MKKFLAKQPESFSLLPVAASVDRLEESQNGKQLL